MSVHTERITTYRHDGLTFDVRDAGPLDGTPAVLLHGFPQTSTCWDAVAGLLNADGFRTFAPDQRGYSPGARPRGRSAYRMDRLVGDVEALVEEIGTPVHVVGHDWGAAVAWVLATARPDLVRTLTAVSVTHPGAFVRSLRGLDQARRSWYMAFFQLPWLPERMLSRPRSGRRSMRGAGMTREGAARFKQEVVEGGALRGGLGWYRALPFGRPRVLTQKVRVPTTMVWSDRDTALGRRGIDLAAEYVDAPYSLVVLEGVSHWIPDQAPEALAAAVQERAASA